MIEIALPASGSLIINDFGLDSPSQENESTFTGTSQIVDLPGAEKWFASVQTEQLTTELEERDWRRFLFSLRGIRNYFKLPWACQTHPGVKPSVAAGASNGYTLPLTGMTPNTTILKAGQFMTVPLPSGFPRLVMLEADLVSNGAGSATAQLNCLLREVPDQNAVVETLAPYLRARSKSRMLRISTQDGVSVAAFEVREAI